MSTASAATANGVCLVTGASSGIGLAVAEVLLARGVRVIGVARDGKRLGDSLAQHGERALCVALDVTDGPAVARFVNELPAQWQSLDIVIANAGSDVGGRRNFEAGVMEDWASTIETNVTGVMRVVHAVLPGMLARSRGHIITLGSTAGVSVHAGGAAYCASKHALHAFTRSLQQEYRDSPLRITEIMPGLVRTGFALARHRGDREQATQFYDSAPAALDARDVARAVVFAIEQPEGVNIGQLLITPTRNK